MICICRPQPRALLQNRRKASFLLLCNLLDRSQVQGRHCLPGCLNLYRLAAASRPSLVTPASIWHFSARVLRIGIRESDRCIGNGSIEGGSYLAGKGDDGFKVHASMLRSLGCLLCTYLKHSYRWNWASVLFSPGL
jgi:hypothetical protein